MVSDRPRIEFVDWLRGIAAFLVLLQHSLERASPQFLNWSIKYLNFGIVGVVSFFLISGYIIAHSAGNKPTPVFLINRFFRIFPLYWVVLLLGVITALFCKEVANMSTVIANLLLIQNYTGFTSYVGGSWTLPLELVFYLLFIFRKKIPFFKKNPSAFLFLCLSTGSLIFLRYLLGIQVPLGRILLIHSAFQGTLWYESKFIEKRNESKLHFFLLGAAILFYVYLSENPTFAPSCILLSWISAYSLFFLFMQLRPYKRIAEVMQWMGKVSYSVYLFQGMVLTWVIKFDPEPLFFLNVIPLTYLGSIFLHKYVEKPGIAFAKSLGKVRAAD